MHRYTVHRLWLLLLPVGWNPWRMRWEAEAYAVQVRSGWCTVESVAQLEEAVRRFLG